MKRNMDYDFLNENLSLMIETNFQVSNNSLSIYLNEISVLCLFTVIGKAYGIFLFVINTNFTYKT